KSRVYYQLKAHYQQEPVRSFYEMLARLPFKMFINASPDRFLADTLGEGKHSFAFFHKNDPDELAPEPSLEKPLVYNLVGVLDREESLLLTHDDLYEFIEAVLSRQGLPRTITDELYKARSVIFVGFRFEKWYVQLLLRLLKVHDQRNSFARYATKQKFNSDTLSICEKQFRIEFVEEDTEEFFAELLKLCTEKNMLRKLEPSSESLQKQIQRNIEQDELDPAIEKLKAVFDGHDTDLLNEVIGITARHNRLKKRSRQKVMSEEKIEVELARIRDSLLELTLEIE
ncbi:MAG: SIR2 family protein, partial [Bacteroidota bacterium]